MKIEACSGLLEHLKRRGSQSGEWKRTTSLLSRSTKDSERRHSVHKKCTSFEQEFCSHHFDKQEKKTKNVLPSFGFGKRSKSHIVTKDFNVQFVERQRTKSYIVNGLPFNEEQNKTLMDETYGFFSQTKRFSFNENKDLN